MKTASLLTVLTTVLACASSVAAGDDLAAYFHQKGPLAGSLKGDAPLPVYDAD